MDKVIRNETIKEEIHLVELDNGLKVFFMPKENYTKKYAIFATNYGSNDNRFIPIGKKEIEEFPEGIAHFLEHKLFEEPEGNIFDKFAKLGSYVNAFTNFNQTAYLFSCTDRFDENLELLVKFVQNPYFTDENVKKEKGIIEQEIRMYDDSANWKVFFNCLEGLYHNHPVKTDIAGTVESINRITKEDLYNCYDTFYHPSNMIIFMIGKIDFKKAIEIVKVNVKKEVKKGVEIVKDYPEEPKEINKKEVIENLTVSTPLFNIGFKDNDIGFDGEKLILKNITTNILLEMLFGESSEFYKRLYDRGIINSSFGGQFIGARDYGHTLIGGESEDPKKVLSEVLDYIDKVKDDGLSEDEFNRIKKKFMGHHIMDLNSIEYIATSFVSQHFNNSSILEYLDLLDKVSFEDVLNRLKSHLTRYNYTISIINPR